MHDGRISPPADLLCSAHADKLRFRLDSTHISATDGDDGTEDAPFVEVLNNVTEFTCFNLDEMLGNQVRAPNNATKSGDNSNNTSTEVYPIFRLHGVDYIRSNGSGMLAYDPSVVYDWWNIWQGDAGWSDRDYATSLDWNTNVSAAMQLNVYGERWCQNTTHPWIGFSCQHSVGLIGGPTGSDYGAVSISLQPHDLDAPYCLYNATNGVWQAGAWSLRSESSGREILTLFGTAVALVACL